MNVLVVDDEDNARERLSLMIENFPDCHVVGKAHDGIESVFMVDSMPVDLVLMDIRMPRMNGIEAARHISSTEKPPIIIFVTAFAEHALDAFHVHAENYLLKPVRRESLLRALEHTQRNTRHLIREPDSFSDKMKSYICCHTGKNMELIPLSNIYMLRSEEKYSVIYHSRGKSIVDRSLISFEEEYATKLLRVHRNTLVNKAYVKSLLCSGSGNYFLTVKNMDRQIRVSRRNLCAIRNFMKNFSGFLKYVTQKRQVLPHEHH